MAIDLYLYKFSKRRNSTKVPARSEAFKPNVITFKNPTDLITPVIVIAADHETVDAHDKIIRERNYAEMLGRYYWITETISVRLNHWELHMEVDPLATWRKEIKATNAFAMYTTNLGSDGLIDSRLPRELGGAQTKTVVHNIPWELNSGSVVISVVNKNGAENFVLTNISSLQTLMNAWELYIDDLRNWRPELNLPPEVGEPAWDEAKGMEKIFEVVKFVGKTIFNLNKMSQAGWKYIGDWIGHVLGQTLSVSDVSSNIKSVIWYPFTIAAPAIVKEIEIGNFKTGVMGALISPNASMTKLATINAPSYDWHAGFLSRRGYAEWALKVPLAGVYPLSNDLMYNGRRIEVTYNLTVLTGSCNIKVDLVTQDGGGARTVANSHAQLACDMMLGDVTPNLFNVASGIVSAESSVGHAAMGATSAVGGNAYGAIEAFGGAANTAQVAMNIVNEVVNPSSYMIGGYAGNAIFDTELECYLAHFHVSQDPPSGCAQTVGIPTFRQVNLGQVEGYVICNGASVACEGTAKEIDAINAYLNSGAFIE